MLIGVIIEWVSGDHNAVAQWDFGVTPGPNQVVYHKVYRQTPLAFSETFDQTESGNWYWATDNHTKLTHQSGADVDVRSAFTSKGALTDNSDTNYRAINNRYPVFGFAKDLGSVGKKAVRTLFTIGLAQEESLQFNSGKGNAPVRSLWTSYYASESDAVRIL